MFRMVFGGSNTVLIILTDALVMKTAATIISFGFFRYFAVAVLYEHLVHVEQQLRVAEKK